MLDKLFLPGDTAGTYDFKLATGYELASDKSYYDIFLRQGVKFHDGTSCDADAVKWNLDRVRTAEGQSALSSVESIDVIDEYTIRLNLSSWNNQVLSKLTLDACFIISPTSFEENGGSEWASHNPVGTGPFKFQEIKTNAYILERNDDYWEEGLPYLDGVEILLMQDKTVNELALRKGEIDGGWGCAIPDEARAEMMDDPDYRVEAWGGQTAILLYQNTEDPESVWYDVRMRQALEYAIDKETIVSTFAPPFSVPLYNIIKGLELTTTLNNVPRKYDPDKARELMAEANHSDGVEFTIYVDVARWLYDDFFLALQQQWAEVGFIVEYEVCEAAKTAELSQSPLPGNAMHDEAMRGSKGNPMSVVLESLSEGTLYLTGVKRPAEWTSLIEQAILTEELVDAIPILIQMDEIAYNEAMYLPLYSHSSTQVYRSWVHGGTMGIVTGAQIADVWKSQ
jgi:ABC-type transport system substrate-binding protein